MLNLTLDQKFNLIINACLLFEMYITRPGFQKFCLRSLYKYIKRKTKYNKGVTQTEYCLITSHSNMLTVVKWDVLPLSFMSAVWQKTGCGIWYFLSFKTENWKHWLFDTT